MNIQQIEDEEYEANARFDNIQEMYHGLGDDPVSLRYEMQGHWEDEMIEAQDDMEARGGPSFQVALADEIFF